ncbi:DUF2530 domain-containing protein [Bifidobacterium choloepi]|uniref:DUF2530 domain-containing protein n=1 Tax=Bifidobacterium choloepi TaxID=2614131 RepID=A0A6I5MYA0_9BIFI|nr:DUF2530 domain-containing protein [Bifidobacterium choloepi]NEG69578.1 DUF2530 domain-containing protein [Bifidobacterium choloepi]
MKFAPIYDPSERKPSPKPVQVDLRKAFGAGTVVWAIAAVVFGVLLMCGFDGVKTDFVICICGTVIGIVLLIWEFFDRWDYRRLGA